MARPLDDVADRRHLDQPPSIHDAEPVDELRHQPHVVADQNDGGAKLLLHPRQRRHDLALDDDIQGARRLVGDDDAGPQRDRDRDAGALLHAAGKFVRVHPRHAGGQSDGGQQGGNPAFGLRTAETQPVIDERVGNLTPDPQHRVERVHRALRHQRDAGKPQGADAFLIEPGDRGAEKAHIAGLDVSRRLDHPQDREGQRRLAGAGFAGQPEAFAGLQ